MAITCIIRASDDTAEESDVWRRYSRRQEQRGDACFVLAIAGLGVGSAMAIPTIERLPETDLVAAADIRPDAQAMFRQRYEGRAYGSVQELCDDPDVDVVWVATGWRRRTTCTASTWSWLPNEAPSASRPMVC